MELVESKLKGAFLIKPKVFQDDRGFFIEAFNKTKFTDATGLNPDFFQDNESGSKKGSLRGIHFQKPPYTQSKLVRVILGEVQDIIVDLRSSSPTFGMWESYIINDNNKYQLFIPRGFGHAFLTLSEYAIFNYKIDNNYNPASDSGIIWNDPDLDIKWEMESENLILSEKDASLQSFKDYCKNPDFK